MRPSTVEGFELFMKGQEALSRMEHHGIKIDLEYLDGAIETLTKEVKDDEDKLRQTKTYRKIWLPKFGLGAKLSKDSQLGFVLKELGFESREKTTRGMKLDEAELLRFDHQFVKDFLQLKKKKKALGTYLQGIRREVAHDGFLRPSFNLASAGEDRGGGAESLRGSCQDPNAQNIPIRNALMGRLIRPCFIAREGCRLVERDFSGIEVRTAACYTKDPNLIRYIKDSTTDMHRDTALDLFFVTKKEYDEHKDYYKKTIRDCAKNQMVFPEFYGSVFFQTAPAMWESILKREYKFGGSDGVALTEHLRKHGVKELGNCNADYIHEHGTKKGTFVDHVKEVERVMWEERFKVYTQWKRDWYDQYCRRGWFPLKTGFVCQGYYRRNQVLNFAIQGSAFHCLLWVIIRLDDMIRKLGMKTKLILQIHDSLIADVPEDELQDYLSLSEEVMSKHLPKAWKWLIVPIDSEVDVTPIGKSWFDKEAWVETNGVWSKA